jgi:molybdate transport system substrate-binding protein
MKEPDQKPKPKVQRPSFLCNLRPRVFLFLASVILLASFACQPTQQNSANELVVSAAVSLKDAFTEIAALHEKQANVKVHFNFGASGALQKQIESGAPADVFASAGARQMDDLASKGAIVSSSRKDFARNSLVLIVPANASGVTSFIDLTKPEITKIAVGNPKTVPAGQYTEQAFTKLKLLPDIQPKLIYAEDVRQVLDYVVRAEVDAGVVYSSDVLSGRAKIKEVAIASEDSHEPILYPIAIIKESHRQEAAQKFIDLVISAEGQRILARHGFTTVSK